MCFIYNKNNCNIILFKKPNRMPKGISICTGPLTSAVGKEVGVRLGGKRRTDTHIKPTFLSDFCCQGLPFAAVYEPGETVWQGWQGVVFFQGWLEQSALGAPSIPSHSSKEESSCVCSS